MVIYHFPCLESKWSTFRVFLVENFLLQRNVCKSSHVFWCRNEPMSVFDSFTSILDTSLMPSLLVFSPVNRRRFTTELAIPECFFTVCSFAATVNQPVWPCIREFKIPRRRRPRKRRLKSEFAFFQSLSRLLQLIYFVKCKRTLFEPNS